MSKAIYVGVGGVARKVKSIYIGVDGVARKVKKGYIGVGGVARPCWGGGELVDYGTATPLSYTAFEHAAATVGDYALFGGGRRNDLGYASGNGSPVVDAYNKSLVSSTPTALSQGRTFLAAASVGDYALFGGGNRSDSSSAVVDAYNKSLARSTPTTLSVARFYIAAAAAGGYALFGGGRPSSGTGSDIYCFRHENIIRRPV
jgi:hypothetical protein